VSCLAVPLSLLPVGAMGSRRARARYRVGRANSVLAAQLQDLQAKSSLRTPWGSEARSPARVPHDLQRDRVKRTGAGLKWFAAGVELFLRLT
jgi:hypothetical protein